MVRWYVRERHRPTFSRRRADGSFIPGPPLEALRVRDVTPAEMATKQAQPTTFSGQGTRIPGFRKAVFHPFPPTARRHSGPEFPLRNCLRRCASDDDQSGCFLETETINFTNSIRFLSLFFFFLRCSGNCVMLYENVDSMQFYFKRKLKE